MTRPEEPAPPRRAEEPSLTAVGVQWWRSAGLMILVGGVVIAYQVVAFTGEGGTWLNAVMIAIGAGVVVAGLVALRRDRAAHLARQPDGDPKRGRDGAG